MKLATDKTTIRPTVNKLKPNRKAASLGGPDWSSFHCLFEDPEWLSKYRKNSQGMRKKARDSSKGKFVKIIFIRVVVT